jgi:sulfoxide reductase heme-binding subunit YedZ
LRVGARLARVIESALEPGVGMVSTKRAPVIAATAVSLAALLLVAYLAAGWSEEAARIVVRWTAKIAVVMFAAAFSASSLCALWRGPSTLWLVSNRRRLGLGFALAHSVHLGALIVLGFAFPSPFVEELNAVTILGGGLAYVFMFAMAATSNDRSARALGVTRWRRLHTIGGWYIWLIFTQSYVPRALTDPAYVPFGVLLADVLGLRIARRLRVSGRVPAGSNPSSTGSPPA